MKPDTDQELIAKTLQGQTKAYGVLVLRYQDFIYTIVLRIVKKKEEAEEIAQDTFVKAYEKLSSFQGTSKFSSWLYSIAYRKALDFLKKQRRFKPEVDIEAIPSGSVASIENGLQKMITKERSELIQDCLMQLPETNAAIITFYYFEGLSVKEISTITELSEDNIKIRLYRSRKQLLGLLAPYIMQNTHNHGTAI